MNCVEFHHHEASIENFPMTAQGGASKVGQPFPAAILPEIQ
jgi:hypothetical protein